MKRDSYLPLPLSLSLALGGVGCAAQAEDPGVGVGVMAASSELEAVPASRLCVTEGALSATDDGRLAVHVPGMRGVVAGDTSRVAELAFAYTGASASTAALASGEVRRQIGLKLRAQDSCNLVYVMWRIAPTPGIVVQVKRNEGASTHEACGNRGYDVIEVEDAAQPAPIRAGEAHTLRAELDGRRLRVLADGAVAWRGELPEAALAFDGPAGVRSDNGDFDFVLRVPGGARAGGACSAGRAAAN